MTRMDCRWSCMSKMKKTRKPGGGRKKLKPEYDAGKNLKEQMESAVALYDSEMSLQAIADALNLNPIKVRKLLITAGVYESEVAKKVKNTFEEYRETQDYKTSILSTANTLQLSKASVTSYEVRKGRNGEYTKELWIDRREKSKSLAWSSIVLALKNIKGEVVSRPKALGDIRGVTYIYGMFYRFGLINVPDKAKEKMGRPKDRKK